MNKLKPQKRKIKKKKRVGKKTHKTVIINGEDILLLRHHVAKAAASRVLE